ncbi:hypothetical protein KFK09_028958 [Dendrobium nobile]|uniref:Uncharacterized protein n=1 Tax=Dendrobium nobile TaxID=94219 RepID=A0A8T3A446_DENNO|nr:hypothetical protein KFK09_028958 [Dendrobium nobile]
MQIPLTLIFHVQVSFFMFDDFFSWSAILVGVERLKKLANTQTKGLSRSGLTVGKKLRKVAMKIFLVLFAGRSQVTQEERKTQDRDLREDLQGKGSSTSVTSRFSAFSKREKNEKVLCRRHEGENRGWHSATPGGERESKKILEPILLTRSSLMSLTLSF